jgi:hypothetical protein
VAAQQNTVILWTGQATLTHKHSGAIENVRVEWSRTADLTFSVDSRRKIDPKTLSLSHTLNGAWIPKGGSPVTARHNGTAVSQQQIDLALVQMSVKTCAPELSAPVGGLADDTLLLSVVSTPGVVYRFPGAGETNAELGLIMRTEFPYDHEQTEFDPPEVDVYQHQATGPIPAGVGGVLNPPNTPAKMTVTLKRKPLKLDYQPLAKDNVNSTPRGKGYSPVTSSYARGKGGWFLHGNSRIQVMVDGKDATTSFEITRFIADSIQSIDGQGRRVGQIRSGAWHVDTEAVGGLWIDIPGEHLVDPPGKWPQQRYMQEYLVGARRFPEFGGLYFIVVIDTKPNGYRVRMYPAQTISIAQWCAIKARTSPFRNEGSSGTPVDSGWQTVR